MNGKQKLSLPCDTKIPKKEHRVRKTEPMIPEMYVRKHKKYQNNVYFCDASEK